MGDFDEVYLTQGADAVNHHIFYGGALMFPVNTGSYSVEAGKNFRIPVSMRSKLPFVVRTLFGRCYAGPPGPAPLGTAKFTVGVAGRQTSDGRVLQLGTRSISVDFTNTAQTIEDHYVDIDITAMLYADIESVSILYYRLQGREGDTLEFPVGIMLCRVLP
jgi:hypothetical protein